MNTPNEFLNDLFVSQKKLYVLSPKCTIARFNILDLKYEFEIFAFEILDNYRRASGFYDIKSYQYKLSVLPNFPIFDKLLEDAGGDEDQVANYIICSDPKRRIIRSLVNEAFANKNENIKVEMLHKNLLDQRKDDVKECVDSLLKRFYGSEITISEDIIRWLEKEIVWRAY